MGNKTTSTQYGAGVLHTVIDVLRKRYASLLMTGGHTDPSFDGGDPLGPLFLHAVAHNKAGAVCSWLRLTSVLFLNTVRRSWLFLFVLTSTLSVRPYFSCDIGTF